MSAYTFNKNHHTYFLFLLMSHLPLIMKYLSLTAVI